MGGRYGEDALVVAVSAPAVDGRATDAVLAAVAESFGLRPRQVELVSGATNRTKVLRLVGDASTLAARRDTLLGSG